MSAVHTYKVTNKYVKHFSPNHLRWYESDMTKNKHSPSKTIQSKWPRDTFFWSFLSLPQQLRKTKQCAPNLFMFFNRIWKIESEIDLNVACLAELGERVAVDCNENSNVWPTELTRTNWIYRRINMRRVNVCASQNNRKKIKIPRKCSKMGSVLRVFWTVLRMDAAKTTS